MVNLLPGFTFSAGDPTIRGYAEAAGNVLIDGERVSDKQFTLDTVLQQIPADQVDHIEVIEGGRPGLEMLGQTVVANVVRKKEANDKVIVTLSNAVFFNGRNTPGGTVELDKYWSRGGTLTAALSADQYVELAEGMALM
jgi:outer membrane receptor for ferrienterochelin and colicin